MIVTCDHKTCGDLATVCGRTFDDVTHNTICPHPRLPAQPAKLSLMELELATLWDINPEPASDLHQLDREIYRFPTSRE